MSNKVYITTPIYYVNDVPHIGHAYTTLACDVLSRYYRMRGIQTRFLTGTDEHGQKVEKAANLANMSEIAFADMNSLKFRNLLTTMGIVADDFIRTTEDRHKLAVTELWNILRQNGQIYEGTYSGWYSVRDECFYSAKEVVNGKAPTGASVEWIKESSYFFRLSAWQDKLLQFYENNLDFINPIGRRAEVLAFVRSGLEDLSVSRSSFNWGIKVPDDPKRVIYVWLDALINYISALGFPNTDNQYYQDFWHSDTTDRIHVVGKDILRFHAVYWPAMLMAANLPLPRRIFAHGWWTNEGEKISKSLGNTIDPFKLVDDFGLDQVRYFLLREICFGHDGDFSKSALLTRANSDLANKFGNLLHRSVSIAYKKYNGRVPQPTDDFTEPLPNYSEIEQKMADAMHGCKFQDYIFLALRLASSTNEFLDRLAPWKLTDDSHPKLCNVMYSALEHIRLIAIILLPIIPTSANKMLDVLGVNAEDRFTLSKAIIPGSQMISPSPIFPKLELHKDVTPKQSP